MRALLLLLLLQGCYGMPGDDRSCAEDCIERGRDDGYTDTGGLRCVCLVLDDAGAR